MNEISKENSVERVTMEDCKVKLNGGRRKMSK